MGVYVNTAVSKPLFTFGNLKLPKYTAIFNMSPAFQCRANELGMCQLPNPNRCYAMKAERLYPATRNMRQREMEFWLQCTVKGFISAFDRETERRRIKYLRFNVSGDFISFNCVVKADKIAEILLGRGITTYCYTARTDFDYSQIKYLVINGSNEMVHNRFKILYTDEEVRAHKREGNPICVSDCRKCTMCTKKLGLEIGVKLH